MNQTVSPKALPINYFLIIGIVVFKAYSGDFMVSPGIVVAKTYYTRNPSTGRTMEYYVTEIGLDLDMCYTVSTSHSFSANAGIGGGGPSGALPLTFYAFGTSYQFGKKKKGFAAGPTIQISSGGFAAGAKISLFRMDFRIFAWPRHIAAITIGFSLG